MTSPPELQAGGDGRRVPDRSARRDALAGIGPGLLAAGMLSTAGIAAWAAQGKTAKSPSASSRAGGSRFPNPVVLTHDGRRLRFFDDLVRGRIVLLNMMYAQCSNICPPMTANLLNVQRMLGPRAGSDVFMVSITLLPEHDTPQALAEYAQRYRIGGGWTFVTGRPDDIERLRLAFGFFDVDPVVDADRSQHTGMVRIGNDALDRWCMNPALAEPEQICESIRAVDPHKRPFVGYDRRLQL
ncbi:SCO family protein [Methylibium sp.]|uniref:SCO family protein n=1 Tax=Methylibium sp. TaxID=2067992 RepID=UPI0017A146D4|nr:SCO family protein [Methylibium sp.]MBA3589382.1 SCO family protein [Methylibium sp.]